MHKQLLKLKPFERIPGVNIHRIFFYPEIILKMSRSFAIVFAALFFVASINANTSPSKAQDAPVDTAVKSIIDFLIRGLEHTLLPGLDDLTEGTVNGFLPIVEDTLEENIKTLLDTLNSNLPAEMKEGGRTFIGTISMASMMIPDSPLIPHSNYSTRRLAADVITIAEYLFHDKSMKTGKVH